MQWLPFFVGALAAGVSSSSSALYTDPTDVGYGSAAVPASVGPTHSIPSSARQKQVHKVQLTEAEAEAYGARCLDGSPYAFYTSGDASSATDWVVYLEGGGECDTADDCAQRAQTGGDMGSSFGLPKQIDEAGVSDGITDSRTKKNPHFAPFGTIYLPYCSGDDWLGTMRWKCDPWIRDCTAFPSANPSNDESSLFFSGHNNFVAAMNLTLFASARSAVRYNTPGSLRSVVLTGGSAGGQGAYAHADYLSDTISAVGSTTTHVLTNPQYGVFTPTTTFHDWKRGEVTPLSRPYPSSGNPTGVPLWLANVSTFLPHRCVTALSPAERHGPFQEMLCALAPRIAQTIESPVFMSLNLFDAWLTGVEEKCCGPFGGAKQVGPTSELDKHFDYLMSVTAPATRMAVHAATDTNVALPSAAKKNGAFVPPCIEHGMQWHEHVAPKIDGCDHAAAVASWFFGITNGQRDWNGKHVKVCKRVLISGADTAKELAKLQCNDGQIRIH